jgi:hypothetical protein
VWGNHYYSTPMNIVDYNSNSFFFFLCFDHFFFDYWYFFIINLVLTLCVYWDLKLMIYFNLHFIWLSHIDGVPFFNWTKKYIFRKNHVIKLYKTHKLICGFDRLIRFTDLTSFFFILSFNIDLILNWLS